MDIAQEALGNLGALATKAYTGRGLALGTTPSGKKLVQVYWLTGRSPNSRNRVLTAEGGKVWTEAADPSKVENPSLIIYTAMDEQDGMYVVSNGAQTDAVMSSSGAPMTLNHVMQGWEFEPDAPNFTPRITGATFIDAARALQEFSILRRQPDGSCDRFWAFYNEDMIPPSIGYCVTTYTGEDTNPLPSFVGAPYPVPLLETIGGIMETFRSRLENEHLISMAVKLIDRATGESQVQIYNRYEKVA